MSASIDARSRELLDAKNFAHVATVSRDGTPHVAVAWVDAVDDEVLVNSAEGRVWPSNLDRDPRVTVVVANLENPYEYVTIKGEAVEITPQGADEHIDSLAKKYLDKDEYPFRQPGENRLKIRIRPDKVSLRGG
jgi:PPOX class probable F420-dependent enzyme